MIITPQQIAMVARREARNPLRISVTCHEAAMVLAVDDVVRVTHETPGFVLKKFWVDAIGILPDGHVRLQLVEYDATAYDYNAQDDTPFAPDTNLITSRGSLVARIPATSFVDQFQSSGLRRNVVDDGGLHPPDANSVSYEAFWPIPAGAVVEGFEVRWYLQDGDPTQDAEAIFYHNDDAGNSTTMTSVLHEAVGWTTTPATTGGVEPRSGTIKVLVHLNPSDASGVTASLMWVDILYSTEKPS